MQITRKMLVEWNACKSGLDWFDNNFSEDGQEYQEILNKLAEKNEAGYAEWLIRKAGVQDIVLEIDELVSENCFFFAGEIKVTGNIQIKFRLGTVVGMIVAFDNIEKAGDIDPTLVAGGIKIALITTVTRLS